MTKMHLVLKQFPLKLLLNHELSHDLLISQNYVYVNLHR